MEIVVAVKPVPEADTRLRSNSSQTELDGEGVKWVLAGYDESAVEQALLLKESSPGSKVRTVSFGPAPRTEEVLRASIALGSDAATWVEAPADLFVDPMLAARALAVAVSRYPHDLVLLGKQAGDDESGIVPGALAELLGLPDFGAVVDLRWDAPHQLLSFQRATDAGIEAWEAKPPIVVGLQRAWNDPRTAKLPNILKSRKSPIERIPWVELAAALGAASEASTRPLKFRLPAPRTGAKMVEYKTPKEAAEKLVRLLREEAKVFP